MGAVTTDAGLIGIYKIWYTDAEMENLLFRSSVLAKRIKKTRIGGRTYNFAAMYSRGGAAAGDMTVAAANAASGTGKNAEFAVTPGQIFSVFNITQQEILASTNVRGAYVPAAVNKTFAATDAFRKLFATSLYGMGFGEIGKAPLVAALNVGSNTINFVDMSLVVKLDIGSQFYVTDGALPSSNLRTSLNEVTAIDGTTVTFTATAANAWAVTDWVEIAGCRSGTTPLLPVGLRGWLPDLADRTGGVWTGYIATAFDGVNRSVYPSRLAGNFIKAAGGEKKMDTIVRAIDSVRTAGGNPKLLVINNKDYLDIVVELNAQTSYFNQQNIKGQKSSQVENTVARGISDMSYIFSTSWVDKVIDDPFCPKGIAYILDEDTLEFACLTNVDKPINESITGNEPGVDAITSTGAPEMQYKFILDDYITVQPGVNTVNGPASQVSLNMYGSWVVRAPGHNCVISF